MFSNKTISPLHLCAKKENDVRSKRFEMPLYDIYQYRFHFYSHNDEYTYIYFEIIHFYDSESSYVQGSYL